MIPVFRLHPNAKLPERQHATDAGYDLSSVEDVTLRPGQTITVRTGLAMELPDHLFGWVVDRSSLSTQGVKVLGGIIDPGYRGEIRVVLHYLYHHPDGKDNQRFIPAGKRVAQLLLLPRVNAVFHPAVTLSESDRGANGFGSTDRKGME